MEKEEIKQEQKQQEPEVLQEENSTEAKSEEKCCCKEEKHKCKCEKKNKKEEKIKEELKKLEEENKHLIEKVQLAQAELINYRKRKDEETANILKYANQDLIMELIPIVDNFERAIKLDDNDLTDDLSKFLAGFKMMYASLADLLKKFGVEEISRVGEKFDPQQEEALMTDCVPEMEDEEVIEVLLKGYKYKGRVIRPASVKINQI